MEPSNLQIDTQKSLGKGFLGYIFLGKLGNETVAVESLQVHFEKQEQINTLGDEVRKLMFVLCFEKT